MTLVDTPCYAYQVSETEQGEFEMTTTEIREAFEALIAQARAGVLTAGAAGQLVQKASKIIAGCKVEVRINVGAETWWTVNTGITSGYTGTNYAEAVGTLILAV